MNNFDQSSSGVNLDLNCFWDNDLAREWFNDNFKAIQFSDPILLYTEGGEFSDFEPLANKKEILAYILEEFCDNYADKRELVERIRYYSNNWRAMNDAQALELLKEYEGETIFFEVLDKLPSANFELTSATGFSQGDYSEIIVPKNSYAFKNKSLDFDNLIYNTPLFCCLEIDGKEYYISEETKDVYNYDKKELVSILDRQLKHNKKEYILNWFSDNLPENPKHI